MNRQDLIQLVDFIAEIAQIEGNEWFREKVVQKLGGDVEIGASHKIDEIYELCLRKIAEDQAIQFYSDFKLVNIKSKLIEDFVRMEKFRRENNFEDFCLALYQQVEGIVNELSSEVVKQHIIDNKDVVLFKEFNKETGRNEERTLKNLVFFFNMSDLELYEKFQKEMKAWDFMEKYRAILYYYYFNKGYRSYFTKLSITGYELYQSRNLNHRGGLVTDKQKRTIEKVRIDSHKYYFKFIGFLEDFISRINQHVASDTTL